MTDFLKRIRIVLVHTTHPGNIGAAARAMKNMGLSQLHLVAPREFPDPRASARAANAVDLLERARQHESLEQALAGCSLVMGTSARQRRIPWELEDVRGAAERAASEAGERDIAVLFGREDRGLTNEELQRCHFHLNIPADPVYSSLNLAMAVQIVCYELRRAALATQVVQEWDQPPADTEDVERFFEHLHATLTDLGFLRPGAPKQLMTRLRRLFSRTRLDEMEVSILRGILTSTDQWIERARSARTKPEQEAADRPDDPPE